MCTLIFLYYFLKGFPIIAMHNRYVPLNCIDGPPRVSEGKFKVYYPIDFSSKGSWIGFNDKMLFMAVTDQHTDNPPNPYRSRGLLLMDILTYFSEASEALNYLERELVKGYKKGNFILADSREAYHVLYDERIETTVLNPGIHVLTNLTIKEWTKIENIDPELLRYVELRRRRAIELASKLNPVNIDGIIEELKLIASDHGNEIGKGSICYHNGGEWHMSSSTIIALSDKLKDSKILYCKGNPCQGKFIDYSQILFNEGVMEVSRRSDKLIGKRIALCLTGSVACIEAPKLARELRRHGADVTCYMTKAAVDYGVSPYLMEWATGKHVILKLTGMTEHLENYDLAIVYPATLNIIGKIAHGIADNPVTTLCASIDPIKLLIVPAMNLKLYNNEFLRENIEKLKKLGVTFVMPRISEGAAKIATVDEVIDHAIRCLSTSKLRERRVLILTGPTRYDLDPVRYISSRSTGKLGYYLAKEAFHRGCRVGVVYGQGLVNFPTYIRTINVYTTEDMLTETLKEIERENYEIAIFSAAILDFKPSLYLDEKVKSGSIWSIELRPTVKVIEEVSKKYLNLIIVGFKLEYKVPREYLIMKAKEELMKVGASLVVANDLSEVSGERHRAYIVNREGEVVEFDGTKEELARKIFDLLEEII